MSASHSRKVQVSVPTRPVRLPREPPPPALSAARRVLRPAQCAATPGVVLRWARRARAAGGMMSGLLKSRDLDPVTKRYVDTCLHERGYQTLGWQ